MICNNCGAELPEYVKFCNKCGTSLPTTPPTEQYAPPPTGQYPPPPSVGQYPAYPGAAYKIKKPISIGAIIAIGIGVIAVIAVVLSFIVFGGGSEEKRILDSGIIGTWRMTEYDKYQSADGTWIDPFGGEYPTYEFRADGTYVVKDVSVPFSGTFSVRGGIITFTTNNGSASSKFNISGNELVLITDYTEKVGDSEFTEKFKRIGA